MVRTTETIENGPAAMDYWSQNCFHRQVERYLEDVNLRLHGDITLTDMDRCLRDVRVKEMCLHNVMSLDLGWRADVTLEYWVKSVQAIWREADRDQTLEEFDIIKSIAVISRHSKDHKNKQARIF